MNTSTFTQPLVRATPLAVLLLLLASAASCTKSEVDVKPIEVKPIHITVDVNVRIDRQLDEFFAFEEELAPATRPATTQTVTP